MTDREIIEKATKSLKSLKLLADYNEVKVNREISDLLLDIDPAIEFEYRVHFRFNPPIRGTGATVTVDRKTHKLLKSSQKVGFIGFRKSCSKFRVGSAECKEAADSEDLQSVQNG
ncbi:MULTISPECIES: hypothetical protein [unclassified Flavobacterium]|uniref:hypothetical protein n=1 Tax=unclassified Flavobacterium TaxID=196869 RepID=UPI001F12D2ED|nr:MULTISPECIES: hypothetical protein [unclassified Flavobacterium]UMY66465.1 hypothetical protein MKO97_03530 [Flavobacterium sp. HJ-32-4]